MSLDIENCRLAGGVQLSAELLLTCSGVKVAFPEASRIRSTGLQLAVGGLLSPTVIVAVVDEEHPFAETAFMFKSVL